MVKFKRNILQFLMKIFLRATYMLSLEFSSDSRYSKDIFQREMKIYGHKILYMNFYIVFIHNYPKLETTLI
jgi:hypothetical protein